MDSSKFLVKFLLLVVCLIETAFADAKVDGFFRESLVKGGFFENNPEINQSEGTSAKPDSFFISREERRLNPSKAPSNSIKLPQHSIRIRNRSIGFPTRWGNQVYSEGELISQ